MKYTYDQYQACYYLHRLFPYLQTTGDYQRDLILSAKKIDENLIPGLKEVDVYNDIKKREEMTGKLEKGLAKLGALFGKLTPC